MTCRFPCLFVLSVLLMGCAPPADNPSPPASTANVPAGHGMDHAGMPSMARLHELSGAAFDAAFASEMIEHHQGAVEMSEEALKSAPRDEVKVAARKIIADQEKEIALMTAWVKEWTGKAPDPELREVMKRDMASMMTAFTTECRTDCDRAFLTHMKTHHQMAVDMAQMATDKAQEPELKKLAAGIIESQSKEIEQFDAWLRAWYPTG